MTRQQYTYTNVRIHFFCSESANVHLSLEESNLNRFTQHSKYSVSLSHTKHKWHCDDATTDAVYQNTDDTHLLGVCC